MDNFFKIGILVCICVITCIFIAQYLEKKELDERQVKIVLLKSCTGKFQYQNEYYAACPLDKFINLNYAEYVGFDTTVQDVPDQFELNRESERKDFRDKILKSGLEFGLMLIIFTVALRLMFYLREKGVL